MSVIEKPSERNRWVVSNIPSHHYIFVVFEMTFIPFGDVVPFTKFTVVSPFASRFAHAMFDTLAVFIPDACHKFKIDHPPFCFDQRRKCYFTRGTAFPSVTF